MERGEVLPLIRSSHIFAATIREVLELGVLREAGAVPLRPTQVRVLKLLSLNGAYQLNRVAAFLGVSSPAATKTVDKLETMGLVTRSPLAGDRRVVLLSLSPEGSRVVKAYEEGQAAFVRRALTGCEREEIELFASLLERISLAMIECSGISGGPCLRCASYVEDDCPVGRLTGDCAYRRAGTGTKVGRKAGKRNTGAGQGRPLQGKAEPEPGAASARSRG